METYHLGLIVPSRAPRRRYSPTPTAEYSSRRELSFQQFAEIRDANHAIRKHREQLEFLDLVHWNLEEYLGLEERLLLEGLGPATSERRSSELNLNRCLMNLLASIRAYLDHTETDLKRRFGSDGVRYARFKDLTSKLYDRNFSYRFVYRLRNFAQHCGLPLDSFQHKSSSTSRTLRCAVKRKRLLDGFDWGSLRAEIEGLPDEVELTEYLVACTHYLAWLHLQLCAEEIPAVREAIGLLLRSVEPLRGELGVPVVFSVSVAPASEISPAGGRSVTIQQFVLDVQLATELEAELPRSEKPPS